MQTFLPFANFRKSAESLDRARLGKQRSENLQIYRSITEGGGWEDHPAVRMWHRHTDALVLYAWEILGEWFRRGYNDGTITYWTPIYKSLKLPVCLPWWIGNENFHRSHRSMLLQKQPEWYRDRLGWKEPILPYWWPSHHEPYGYRAFPEVCPSSSIP